MVINLERDALVAKAARALRPFRNIDIPSLAVAAIRLAGFSPEAARELASDAMRVERARRRTTPVTGGR